MSNQPQKQSPSVLLGKKHASTEPANPEQKPSVKPDDIQDKPIPAETGRAPVQADKSNTRRT